MSAAELLRDLAVRGVGVRRTGDQLALRGPVPADLLAACREHKAAMLALIRERERFETCHRCGALPCNTEIGGVDLNGWLCDRCLIAAGLLPVGRAR